MASNTISVGSLGIAARASDPTSSITGSFTTVTGFNSVSFDTTGGFNPTTGEYTVSIDGSYQALATFVVVATFAANDTVQVKLVKNGVGYSTSLTRAAASLTALGICFSSSVDCVAGDVLTFEILSSAGGSFSSGAPYNYVSFNLDGE